MPGLEVQRYLEGLGRFGIHMGLSRVRRLMEELGNPHLAYRTIHVTGTNGKGSVCRMLACILESAGYRTGLYLSPHLERFNERISINGRNIPDASLERAVRKVRPIVDAMAEKGHQCTYFEATTAMAFEHFRRAKVDIAVIEVGLGGRLDATNVIEPIVSVITNVSLEHTEHLGATVERVAAEKAGIIKPGAPVVTAAWDRAALGVIERVARKNRSPFHLMQREVRRRPLGWDLHGQRFDIYTDNGQYRGLFTPMLGRFQLTNAALAVLTAELLSGAGLRVTEKSIARGIRRAWLPGRMELIEGKPSLLLDCAHNPGAAAEAAGEVARIKERGGFGKVHLLFGIMKDKDLKGVLGPFLRSADTLTYTEFPSERSRPVESARSEVVAIAAKAGVREVSFSKRPTEALDAVLGRAEKGELVWCAGSMYLIGELRGELRRRGLVGG
ncbi:MAG: folylpolyglutamate synthase/dihydrofolate synthase family protein [Thermoplasmata archaeon]